MPFLLFTFPSPWARKIVTQKESRKPSSRQPPLWWSPSLTRPAGSLRTARSELWCSSEALLPLWSLSSVSSILNSPFPRETMSRGASIPAWLVLRPCSSVNFYLLWIALSNHPLVLQNRAFIHLSTCLNADVADLCEHASYLLRRVSPTEFERVRHQPGWSWVSDTVPSSGSQTLTTSWR